MEKPISPNKRIGFLMTVVTLLFILVSVGIAFLPKTFTRLPIAALILNALCISGLSILLPTVIHIGVGRRAYDDYNLKRFSPRQIIPCILMGIGACFGALALANILEGMFAQVGVGGSTSSLKVPLLTNPVNIGVTVVTLAIIPAIAEELLCRGAILYSLRSLGMRKAALISGLFFALLHTNLIKMPMYLLLGYLLGVIAYKSKSVYTAMITHFMYNLTLIILQILADLPWLKRISEPFSIKSWDFWIVILIFSAIALVFLIVGLMTFEKNRRKRDQKCASELSTTEIALNDEYNAYGEPHVSFGIPSIIWSMGAFLMLTILNFVELCK